MRKIINEVIKVDKDDDNLAILKLSQKPLKIINIKTVRTNEFEWTKYIKYTTYSKISYEQLVNQLVKERYSDSEEFAILRKAINGITDEYLIYNAYVEECKTRAKEFIAEREKNCK